MTSHNALQQEATRFFRTRFDGVIRIDVNDTSGQIWVDGFTDPPTIDLSAPQHTDTPCVWRSSASTLLRLFVLEERRVESAFLAGRLSIGGDMAIMARLETKGITL